MEKIVEKMVEELGISEEEFMAGIELTGAKKTIMVDTYLDSVSSFETTMMQEVPLMDVEDLLQVLGRYRDYLLLWRLSEQKQKNRYIEDKVKEKIRHVEDMQIRIKSSSGGVLKGMGDKEVVIINTEIPYGVLRMMGDKSLCILVENEGKSEYLPCWLTEIVNIRVVILYPQADFVTPYELRQIKNVDDEDENVKELIRVLGEE